MSAYGSMPARSRVSRAGPCSGRPVRHHRSPGTRPLRSERPTAQSIVCVDEMRAVPARCLRRLRLLSPLRQQAGRGDTCAPAAADADRRSATVLFADLSGFTTISERLDPEDVRACRPTCSPRCAASSNGSMHSSRSSSVTRSWRSSVRRWRTRTTRSAPCARRSRCTRARPSSASVGATSSALRSRCTSASTPAGSWPGRLGTSADAAYAVTGDAVNTAARLQSAAGAGQTLVSSRHPPADRARVRVRGRRHAGAERQGRAAAGVSAARCPR